ncbi:hypothetical protein KY362_04975 [Candidatus Woesearchaeota archaeon]|nr:hypothetical protein [Candidatus Woesearchaeota archaeon]
MEELYNQLKARHSLPDFDMMDQEFEISLIEEEEFLLRNIRHKVLDKIESATKLFDNLLHPDAGFASYRESNVFEDKDREEMITLYKRLMFFKRTITALEFDDSDELNAKFINDFMEAWPGMKKQVLDFAKRLRDSWKKDITKKEVVGYLG